MDILVDVAFWQFSNNPPNIFSCSFAVNVVCYWFRSYSFFWVYLKAKKSVPMRLCFSFHWVHFKHDRCIFEICHMVDSLITLLGFILVYTGSFQSYMNFWWCLHFWDHIGLCFWFIGCYLPNFHFSWCNCWIFAWLKLLIGVLLSALVGFSPGMPTR